MGVRLAREIKEAEVRLNPYFIIAGCEFGWTEVTSFTNPHGLSADSEIMLALVQKEVDRLDAQHDNECGPDHDIVGIIRRIDKPRQINAQKEGISLARQLNAQTGIIF